MRMKTEKKNCIAFLTAALLLLVTLFAPRLQAQAAEKGQTGTITVNFPVEGTEFSIYRIGTASEDGACVLSEPYASYGVALEDSSAASLLASYIGKAEVSADATAVTDAQGNAVFKDLEQALYLVSSVTAADGEDIYIASAVLISLPQTEDGELTWNPTIVGKYEHIPPETKETDLTVLKVWKNDDSSIRPAEITVCLLCDNASAEGVIENDEVVLNADNNWTYTWEGLPADHSWTVIEKEVPQGYKVYSFTSDQSNSICLVNMGQTPETPSTPEKPNGSLPQTGQLWWPVLVATAAGLFFILIGLLIKSRN